MDLLKTIFQKSKFFYVSIVVLSILNGLLNISLLLFVNHVINQSPLPLQLPPQYDWVAFLFILTLALVSNKMFQTRMIHLTNEVLFDFEISILKKLKSTYYESFEKLGNERVFTAIDDTRMLANLPEVFMNAFHSFIVVICCFVYLFWMSWLGGIVILALMGALLLFYLVRNVRIEKELNQLRDLNDRYYRYLADLIYGFKEIKMSILKNENIHHKYLWKNRIIGKEINVRTAINYLSNELTGSYSWYLVLGVIMFGLPRLFNFDLSLMTAYLITILYLMGPVAVLITLVPTYTRVKISLERLAGFDKMILNAFPDKGTEKVSATSPFSDFEKIRFEEVVYGYYSPDEQKSFKVGPITLEIQKGEIVFIIGGNGSGKSTFINLLTGLYKPVSGQIYLNDQVVTSENYTQYSNQIAAVFTNSYLFSENYGDFQLKDNAKFDHYTSQLKLSEVLQFNEESQTIKNQLSKGQQKRLSLIYALLEEKEILVLDEWAAEQDPNFRKYFYQKLLPDFREQGKTIIAVTHDDDFFEAATRIVKFNYGLIVSDELNLVEQTDKG